MELNIRGNSTGGGLVIDKQEKVSLEKQSSSPWSSVRRTKTSPIRRYVIKRRWCIRVYGQLRSDKLLLLTFESVEPKIDRTAGAGSKKMDFHCVANKSLATIRRSFLFGQKNE